MARNLDPKCKRCRRVGEKLFLKGEKCISPKCPMVRRNYPPGQHGQQGNRRISSYGEQLKEKQKARVTYGMLEKQFRTYYEKAVRQKGNTGERLLQLLELRLDNIVYRLGLASSRQSARQLVRHGHFTVNGKSVTLPSYHVSPGAAIAVVERRRQNAHWTAYAKSIENGKDVAEWLSLDHKALQGTIVRPPTQEELKTNLIMPQIVEYYSR